MKRCIFCMISKKEIPANIVFENDKVISFFDINPLSRGHILIVTKDHYDDLTFIDQDSWNFIFPILSQSFSMLKDNFSPKGFNIVSNIGEEAYQTIKHLHIHLIPKYKKNEGFKWG